MNTQIKHVVVVGGGTAGWLSAAYMHRWMKLCGVHDATVTLVESEDIGIIGVGEATIPDLKEALRFLQIEEHDFMRKTNATFKNAIKFVNWREDPSVAGQHWYYHPFERPSVINGMPLFDLWLNARNDYNLKLDFTSTAGFAPTLCEHFRSPRTPNDKPFQSKINYAYHLDAVLFGRYLRELSVKRGVRHVVDTVTDILLDDRGFVRAVKTKEHGDLEGQLFIDCSGFSGLIINKVYKSPFTPYSDTLFCDRAVAIQVPYETKSGPINPFTTSTAVNSGWIWEIHLHGKTGGEKASRRGIGYVYSSDFISDDNAEKELRNYIGPSAEGINARRLPMRVGRNEKPWTKNCVAVGLSAGFIEPLESTGISLIIAALRQLTVHFPTLEFPPPLADSYNEAMARLQEHLREFIIMHYCITQREDSEFWKANKNSSVPERLREKLQFWRYRPPNEWDNDWGFRFFPSYSYHCVLSGMNYLPEPGHYGGRRLSEEVVGKYITNHAARKRRILTEYPDHRGSISLLTNEYQI